MKIQIMALKNKRKLIMKKRKKEKIIRIKKKWIKMKILKKNKINKISFRNNNLISNSMEQRKKKQNIYNSLNKAFTFTLNNNDNIQNHSEINPNTTETIQNVGGVKKNKVIKYLQRL